MRTSARTINSKRAAIFILKCYGKLHHDNSEEMKTGGFVHSTLEEDRQTTKLLVR